jgi:clathrin heavy chain
LFTQDIVFWTWINSNTLGLVTATSVFHWPLDTDASPVKIFDRLPTLGDSQIINYKISTDLKWMVLIGIASQNNRVVGNMQLYSKEKNVSQALEGHAAAFSEIKLEGAAAPTKLFSFAVRSATGAKVQSKCAF